VVSTFDVSDRCTACGDACFTPKGAAQPALTTLVSRSEVASRFMNIALPEITKRILAHTARVPKLRRRFSET
jgi:hypothetical protein